MRSSMLTVFVEMKYLLLSVLPTKLMGSLSREFRLYRQSSQGTSGSTYAQSVVPNGTSINVSRAWSLVGHKPDAVANPLESATA